MTPENYPWTIPWKFFILFYGRENLFDFEFKNSFNFADHISSISNCFSSSAKKIDKNFQNDGYPIFRNTVSDSFPLGRMRRI